MLVYSVAITPRLQYIFNFIGKEIEKSVPQYTTSEDDFIKHAGFKINYSDQRITNEEVWIKPHSLLFEKGIQPQSITCFDHKGRKAFFKTNGDYPFDIFAAAFYLLSRYEEYLPHQKDMYGRYDHINSLAFKEKFLDQPLVNHWLEDFKATIKEKFPSSNIQHSTFSILPTYDIDMAWTYLHKGWWRTAGGLLRSLIKGNTKEFSERIRVLRGKERDPFDAYGWMNQLHEKYKLKPYYFFLVPEKKGRYDKNISPAKAAMKDLVHDHVIRYPVGVHPSWRSGDEHHLLKKEIEMLTAITGSSVMASRQHYIRFTLPETFRRLLECGIRFDFSMGYGGINGFRASVATPFYWYDLEKEQQTDLLLFPYCYMEANSFYEQHYTPEQALDEMRHYYNEIKAVNGMFIMIWHNSFLGTSKGLIMWRDVYEKFIREVAS